MKKNKPNIFLLSTIILVFLILLVLFPLQMKNILMTLFTIIEFTAYILLLLSKNIISLIIFLIILFFFTNYCHKRSTTICCIIVLITSISNFIWKWIDKINIKICSFETIIMNIFFIAITIIIVSAYHKANNYLKSAQTKKEK